MNKRIKINIKDNVEIINECGEPIIYEREEFEQAISSHIFYENEEYPELGSYNILDGLDDSDGHNDIDTLAELFNSSFTIESATFTCKREWFIRDLEEITECIVNTSRGLEDIRKAMRTCKLRYRIEGFEEAKALAKAKSYINECILKAL